MVGGHQRKARKARRVNVVNNEYLLTLKPAADLIGVSPHTLRAWSKYQGRIPYLKVGRRKVLFDRRDLEAYLQRTRVEANGSGKGVA
jgi:excisionase family DNA binding protein